MLLIVIATLLFTIVIKKTPRKLKKAAIRIACLGLIARVEMQVAIAFGASVQPLTKITPMVRITVTNKAGFAKTSWINVTVYSSGIVNKIIVYLHFLGGFFPIC
jgi:hypothetical protein